MTPYLTYLDENSDGYQRLLRAYEKMKKIPASKILQSAWMDNGTGEEFTKGEEQVDLINDRVLDPKCGFCSAGMLVKIGLEEIHAPPPQTFSWESFLLEHYGLTNNDVNLITGWNDDPFQAMVKGKKEVTTAKTAGLRAIACLLGLELRFY